MVMSIRVKLLLAMMVPLGLLMAQLMSMNVFIRELQDAVAFIASAHTAIEANFTAAELSPATRGQEAAVTWRDHRRPGDQRSGPAANGLAGTDGADYDRTPFTCRPEEYTGCSRGGHAGL